MGTECQPSWCPPLPTTRSHMQKMHVCVTNSDINHVVLLYKHSNILNSLLVTISANKIISEKRGKQTGIAALLKKRERDPFKPISPIKEKGCL